MYSVSKNFKDAARANTRSISIKALFNGATELTGENLIDATVMEAVATSDGLTMGATISSKLDIKIKMPDDPLQLNRGWVEPFVALNELDEWVPLGKFYNAEISSDDDFETTCKVIAYDGFCKTEENYIPRVTMPNTAEVILSDIAAQCGFELDITEYPEGEFDLYEYTCRQYIGYFAGLLGKNARFDRNGKLTFIWYSEACYGLRPYAIGRELQHSGGCKRLTEQELKLVSITSGTKENTLVCGTGMGISFENPFMTQEVLDGIYQTRGTYGKNILNIDEMLNSNFTKSGDVYTLTRTNLSSSGQTALVPSDPFGATAMDMCNTGLPITISCGTIESTAAELACIFYYYPEGTYACRLTPEVKSHTFLPELPVYAVEFNITGDNVVSGDFINLQNVQIEQDEIATEYQPYGKYLSLAYTPLQVKWRGDPSIEAGDIVMVEDSNGQLQTVYVMEQKIYIGGGLYSEIKCYGKSETDIAFSTSPSDRKIMQVYNALQDAIAAATKLLNGANGGVFEILDEDGDRINDGWIIHSADSRQFIKANLNGIGITTDGGATYRQAMTPEGINADVITVGKLSAQRVAIGDETLGDVLKAEANEYGEIVVTIGSSKNDIKQKQTNDAVTFVNGEGKGLAKFSVTGAEWAAMQEIKYCGFVWTKSPITGNVRFTKLGTVEPIIPDEPDETTYTLTFAAHGVNITEFTLLIDDTTSVPGSQCAGKSFTGKKFTFIPTIGVEIRVYYLVDGSSVAGDSDWILNTDWTLTLTQNTTVEQVEPH